MATEAATSTQASGRAARTRVALTAATLFLVPVVDVLTPTPWVPWPMVTGALLFVLLARAGRLTLDTTYAAFIVLALLCFAPWAFSAAYISGKTLAHGFSLITGATIYYATMRQGLLELLSVRGPWFALKCVYASLAFTSAYILAEAAGANTGAFDLNAVVHHAFTGEYEAFVLGVVYRARGFASEPAVMALFYDFALFAVLPLLSRGWRWRVGYFALILPAYAALFSTASLLVCALAALTLWAWNLRHAFFRASRHAMAVAAVAIVAIGIAGPDIWKAFDDLVTTRVAALLLQEGKDASAATRRGRLLEVAEVAGAYPFGIGFGISPGLGEVGGTYHGLELSAGQISLFGAFVVGGGPLAGIGLAALFVLILRRASRVPIFGAPLAAGGFALALHQLVISEYWLPFFWVALAIAAAFHRWSLEETGAGRAATSAYAAS